MNTQTIENNQVESSESYQMIKDEHLASVVITSQTLAGSRVQMSTYEQVVFSECVFYAVEFKGVVFENCVFENCNFDFSHFRMCKFINCSFVNCHYNASSAIKSVYEDCLLDSKMTDIAQTNGNSTYSSKESHTTDIYIELALAA